MPALGSDPRLARAVYGNVSQLEEAAFTEMANSLRQAAEPSLTRCRVPPPFVCSSEE